MTMRLRAVITEYQAAMKRAAGDTAAMSKSAQGSFAELNKKVGDLGAELTRKVTVPLVATGAGALKLASDFDTAFAQMVGLAGVAGDEVAGLREEVLSLAKETAVGPQKLAEALYFVRSSGIDAANAMEVLTASAKASAAGMGDPAVIARTLSAAINAYGAANLSAAHATDVLVAGIRAASFEPGELAASLGTVIATASTMGITFDQLIATLAVLSRTGLDAAEATTSLNAILTMLSNGGAASEQLLAGHGLSLKKLRDIAAGPGGVIEAMRLLDKTFGDDQEALSTIIPNVRAFRGAMTLLAQDGSIVDGVMQDVADSTGSAGEAFAAVKDTWSFKVKQGIVEVQAALIRLGELAGPLAAVFGATIGGIATAFGKLPVGIQQVVVSLLAVAAAAGPLMKVWGSLAGPATDAIKSIAGGLRTLRAEIIASQQAGMSYGQALVTSLAPIGVAVAAVGVATIGATVLLNEYAKAKQRAAERSREFAQALREEATARAAGEDFSDPANNPSPVRIKAFSQVFGDATTGGQKFGTMLRESGADMTFFIDQIVAGNKHVREFGRAAHEGPSDFLGDTANSFAGAVASGDAYALKLQEIRTQLHLSDGDFITLVRRLGDVSGSVADQTEALQAQQYAAQQAVNAQRAHADAMGASLREVGYLTDGLDSAGLAAQQLGKKTLSEADAQAAAAQAASVHAAELARLEAEAAAAEKELQNLLSLFGAMFSSSFALGDAQTRLADSFADIDSGATSSGGSTRDLEKDQRNLEKATKDVTKAQKDLADAEAALAEARKGPTAREKSDAALDVREATLGVKEATKAQADARKKLLEERDKGKEGDVAGARLDVEAASIRLKRAQDRLTDSQKAQNDVLHSGEETSKDVTSALDDLEKAQQAVADATERQMDAEKTLRGEGASGGPVADRARRIRDSYKEQRDAMKDIVDEMLKSHKPTEDIITQIDAWKVKIDDLRAKYGDFNGELAATSTWLDKLKTKLLDDVFYTRFRAIADAIGGKLGVVIPDFLGSDASGTAGRAKGGPALPFETYEMGEHGPEALTIGTTRPPDKLGKGAAAAEMSGRSATGARTFMVGLDGPQLITMGAQAGWVTPHHQLGDIDGARAAGGPVDAGKTYLVGENGPEIMTVGGFPSTEQLLEQRTAAATPKGPTPTGGRDPRSVAEIVAERTARTAALRRAAVQRRALMRQARTPESSAIAATGGIEAANYPSVNEGLRNSTGAIMPWSGQLSPMPQSPAPTIELVLNNNVSTDIVKITNELIRTSKQNGGLPIRIRSGN